MAKSQISNGQIPNDQIPNLCLQMAIGPPSAFQCCDKKCCTDLEREGETCHKVSAHLQVVPTFENSSLAKAIFFDKLMLLFLQPPYNSQMGSAKESNEFPWDAGKERKGHFPPSNSEQCHKQLNESSSNEFQLKDIFSEISQVHLYSRQVKVETFGKSTQRTLTPRHAAQIVECSQFWVRASFYWGLISLSASQLSIFTFFFSYFVKAHTRKPFLFNWGQAAQKTNPQKWS